WPPPYLSVPSTWDSSAAREGRSGKGMQDWLPASWEPDRLLTPAVTSRASAARWSAFAVEMRHVRGWIAIACNRIAGHQRLEGGDLGRGQGARNGREDRVELRRRASADHGHQRRLLRESPRDQQLARRAVVVGCERADTRDDAVVGRLIRRREPRHVTAPIAGLELAACQKSARQHTVQGGADAELGERGEDLVLGPARGQRILDLKVDDRVHLRGAA